MSIHDGVVNLADDDIPVIIELNEGRVRMSASGREIGDWGSDECHITHVADSTYAISAENETLEFVPSQPAVFAAAVNGSASPAMTAPKAGPEAPPSPAADVAVTSSEPEPTESPAPNDDIREAPPPKPLTMGLFYALCVSTAALAVWSLIAIIF